MISLNVKTMFGVGEELRKYLRKNGISVWMCTGMVFNVVATNRDRQIDMQTDVETESR